MNPHQPLEEVLSAYTNPQQHGGADQKKQLVKPPPAELSLRCPRCDSGNTKFCYYNNYSLSQPRYFCKGCRRYWTQGGSLRNVPVGGGCRKKRTTTTILTTSSSVSTRKPQEDPLFSTTSNSMFLPSTNIVPTPSSFPFDPNYNLAALVYDRLHAVPTNIVPGPTSLEYDSFFFENPNPTPITTTAAVAPGFLDILKGGFLDLDTGGGSYHSLSCYGSSEGVEPVLPLGEVAVEQDSSCRFNADDNKAMVMGLQWQVAAAGEGNVAVDVIGGRDCCWPRGASSSSSWHGLVNSSSLM